MDSAKTATLAFPQHPLCDWKGHCQKHTNIFLNVVSTKTLLNVVSEWVRPTFQC